MRPRLILLTVLVVVSTACGGDATTGAADLDGTWVLADGTTPAGPIAVPDDARVDLRFAEGEVRGVAACNQYVGEVSITGERIRIDGIGATEMGCDPPRMRAEAAYLEALARVTSLARDADTLTLEGDEVGLTFTLEPPERDAALVGTTWTLDTLVDGETASTVLGATATLVLHADGTFTAGTGCRQATGRWSRDGDRVSTSDVGADDVVCDAEVAAQDAHVLAVLTDGFTATVEGARLTVGSADHGLGYMADDAA